MKRTEIVANIRGLVPGLAAHAVEMDRLDGNCPEFDAGARAAAREIVGILQRESIRRVRAYLDRLEEMTRGS